MARKLLTVEEAAARLGLDRQDVVAMVLEDVLPRLHPDVGLPWGTIMLQCALLDRLAELTDCEMGIPPTITALAS